MEIFYTLDNKIDGEEDVNEPVDHKLANLGLRLGEFDELYRYNFDNVDSKFPHSGILE